MPTPILIAHTCSTCPFKERIGAEIRCKFNPPSGQAILTSGPNGQPIVIGNVTQFPVVQPTDWCWQHPDLIRPTRKAILAS